MLSIITVGTNSGVHDELEEHDVHDQELYARGRSVRSGGVRPDSRLSDSNCGYRHSTYRPG
jgi:hypothetical protein